MVFRALPGTAELELSPGLPQVDSLKRSLPAKCCGSKYFHPRHEGELDLVQTPDPGGWKATACLDSWHQSREIYAIRWRLHEFAA